MTMALVQNNEVVKVGLPAELRPLPLPRLKTMGWRVVVGTPKPRETPEPGYQWEYGVDWSVADQAVYGTWVQNQMPQPYPSWTWQEGIGWVPTVPRPDGDDYEWDEDAQSWQPAESEEA